MSFEKDAINLHREKVISEDKAEDRFEEGMRRRNEGDPRKRIAERVWRE
jgi:ribosomal protein L16/L10AE